MVTAHLARSPTASWSRTLGHRWAAPGPTTTTMDILTSLSLAVPVMMGVWLGTIASITTTVTAPSRRSPPAASRLTSAIRGSVLGATMTTMVFWIYSYRILISVA